MRRPLMIVTLVATLIALGCGPELDEQEAANLRGMASDTCDGADLVTEAERQALLAGLKGQLGEISPELQAPLTRFVETLINHHLNSFCLKGFGITPRTMKASLEAERAPELLRLLVREVWEEWTAKLAGTALGNPMTTSPQECVHHLTPFRRLVIQLGQGRRWITVLRQEGGALEACVQHSLFSFLQEDPGQDPDGVIGKMNLNSFGYTYDPAFPQCAARKQPARDRMQPF